MLKKCAKTDLQFTIYDSGFRISLIHGRGRPSREEAFSLGTISQQYLFVKNDLKLTRQLHKGVMLFKV